MISPLSIIDLIINAVGPIPLILFGLVILALLIWRVLSEISASTKKTRRTRSRKNTSADNPRAHPFLNRKEKLEPADNTRALPTFDSQRELQPWEKLTKRQITGMLAEAQKNDQGEIICAGCGVSLELEFLELDHINPKSSNGTDYIDNRILLCHPCNRIKGQRFTLPGLWQENTRRKRMRSLETARDAKDRAWVRAQEAKEGQC